MSSYRLCRYETFFQKFLIDSETLIPQIAMTAESTEKEIFYEHWTSILPVAVVVSLKSSAEPNVSHCVRTLHLIVSDTAGGQQLAEDYAESHSLRTGS